jgi:hypothetical protein
MDPCLITPNFLIRLVLQLLSYFTEWSFVKLLHTAAHEFPHYVPIPQQFIAANVTAHGVKNFPSSVTYKKEDVILNWIFFKTNSLRLFHTKHVASPRRHRRLLGDRDAMIGAVIRTSRFVKRSKNFDVEQARCAVVSLNVIVMGFCCNIFVIF